MRCFDRIGWLCGAVIGLLLCGCAGMQTGPEPGASIGTLHVVFGTEVYVNGKEAFDGRPIYGGDDVATGSGAGVIVNFPDGGFIQLDEQTDPTIRELIEQGKCVILAFFRYGRAFGATGRDCAISTNDPNLASITGGTQFNLEIGGDRSILTVIRGTMRLRLADGERAVHAGQQVAVSRHYLIGIRDLSPEELRRVTSWRQKRPKPGGWCCDKGKVFHSDPESCQRGGGTFFADERSAYDKCKTPLPDNKRAFCEQYAERAVSQNNDNLRRKCGYTGVRWQSNFDAHFNWCMTTDPASAESETRIREADLKRCRPAESIDGGPVPEGHPPDDKPGWCCDDEKVFRSDRENCKRRGGTFFVDERTARDKCKTTLKDDKRPFCEEYARKAVSQNKENLRRKCGYSGQRWLSDDNAHFNWCMDVDGAAAEAERRSREADLKRCGSGGSKQQDGMEKGIDRPGSDYRDFDLRKADPALCRDACMKDAECRAWTYVEPNSAKPRAHCWLKKAVPPARKDRCCVSGVKFTGPE